VSRLTQTLLVGSLFLLGGSALAQERISPVGPDPAIYVAPTTRIVVKVTRYCRGRVCVKVLEVKEVPEDGSALIDQRAERSPRPSVAPVPPSVAPVPPVEANEASPAPPQAQLPPVAAAPRCGSADETAAWRALNVYRAENGLTALTCDALALKVARGHSRDMCERGYFSHYAPEGTAPWDRLRAAGGRFRQAGENIAVGYDTAQGAHDGWVASDGHRNNMLNPAWTRAAVGLVDCSGNRYWTQMFAR
jgi:uncharacterized protein YkwD